MRTRPSELVIGDPHTQPGLVSRILEGTRPVQIVNFYHYNLWPNEKAYCAKCGAKRHRDGFTIELDDGTFALAGSTCGADLWGEQWNVVRKTFQEVLHSAGVILDVRDVLSELESIRATLETNWRPVVDQIHAHQKQFKGPMSLFYNALREAAARPDHSIAVEGEAPLPIVGWAYFAIDDVPREFELALGQLDAAIAAGHGHQTILGVCTVNIGEARDQLDEIAHVARSLRSFFTQEPRILNAIVQSVNVLLFGSGKHRYTTQNRFITDVVANTSIGLPDDYPVLNTEPLRRLRDLKS